jgi:hypothetical protein
MASAKKCIADYCKMCSYDEKQPGSWRQQVEDCTLTKCPLWPVRPLTIATIQLHRKKRGEVDDDTEPETDDE